MILAAGLGTRMRPLSSLCAKPAMPVLGRPVIAYLLTLLARHGVREVMINLHHLPKSITSAVERFCPHGLDIHYLREPNPLGTGGGIRGARDFLAGSDPSVVLAGDMLLDVDLTRLVDTHRRGDSDCTLLLRRDLRAEQFGTIGIDADRRVRRIATRFDLGGEIDAGVFLGVRVLSPAIFDCLPDRPERMPFEDLSDWFAPALDSGNNRIRGQLLESDEVIWEPVGTPSEYLAANLAPPALSYFTPTEIAAEGTKTLGGSADVIVGAGARLGRNAVLERCVIWEDEQVPDECHAHGGVFAGGKFYACDPEE